MVGKPQKPLIPFSLLLQPKASPVPNEPAEPILEPRIRAARIAQLGDATQSTRTGRVWRDDRRRGAVGGSRREDLRRYTLAHCDAIGVSGTVGNLCEGCLVGSLEHCLLRRIELYGRQVRGRRCSLRGVELDSVGVELTDARGDGAWSNKSAPWLFVNSSDQEEKILRTNDDGVAHRGTSDMA
jgi:hypothetical protein